MADCVFCKITAGTIPSYKIYEDADHLAFLDISQFTPGHTLLIPKKHYRYIWDIETGAEFFKLAQKIGNHYRSLGFEFVDTLAFGRMVPHAHLHLVPHNGDDPGWEKALSGLEFFHSDAHPQNTQAELVKLVDRFKLS